jgi:hypothetical protein
VLCRQYQLCSSRVSFRKPRHREIARTSGQETLRPGELPLSRTPVSPPSQAPLPGPRPELQSPSFSSGGEVGSGAAPDRFPRPCPPSPLGRRQSGAQTHLAGAGRGGARTPLPFREADKLSRAPSGHRLVALLRTRGRGAASPGRRAAGGGRGRGRQGRGGRGATWDLRRPPGAPRVLPPAPPLSPPRPASRSPPPRRVGPGRAERLEIVSTANKKRRHMTRQEEGKRGEGGERRGGTERRGRGELERGKTWAGPAAAWDSGADPPGRPWFVAPRPGAPQAQPGPGPRASSPATRRDGGGRRGPAIGAGGAGGAWPVPSPGSGHSGGLALRCWQRVAGTLLPHPHALQGSKVKIKRIMMRARLPRVKRGDSTYPQLLRGCSTPGTL